MPIAISNIFWSEADDAKALAAVKAAGGHGIEVAPTRIAPWEGITDERVKKFKAELQAHDLLSPSLQAIFYNRPNIQLLKSQEEYDAMVEHLHLVARIAETLGAKRLVYGAPKTRLRGELGEEDAYDLAAKRLLPLAKIMADHGVTLVMEAVSPIFGGDFIHTTHEAAKLVRMVDHDGLRLHIDTAAMIDAEENPKELVELHGDMLAHLHYSVPGLGPITPLGSIGEELDAALAKQSYKGWVSIEIMPQDDALPQITPCIKLAKETFQKTLGGH